MTAARWYPHRDYAGEPMRQGEFRDPQPTEPDEVAKHNAAIVAIERLCSAEGFDVPPLVETDDGRVRTFRGAAPDGREFRIGYERFPPGRRPWERPTVKRLVAGSAEPPGSELLP